MRKALFSFIIMLSFIGIVNAAPTQSFYTSSKYVESGSSVTATLRLNNVAAWNVKINSYGATSGCTSESNGLPKSTNSFAGDSGTGKNTTKYLTVTCRATSEGQIGFSVTGDATSADGTNVSISGNAIVTVTAPREKDTNNYLKSLSVTGYELTPAFSKDTLEYTLSVPNTIEKVTIAAEAESVYANVTGNGEVEVIEGTNAFEVKVVSETGVERIYKLVINVEDANPIHVKIKDGNYTIMKNVKTLEVPKTYEATTIKINETEIPAFHSEISKFTLVGVKDAKGTSYFAIYDNEKEEYSLYNENISKEIALYIENPKEELEGFHKTNMLINNQTQEVLLSNSNDDLVVVYAMNIETGKSDYYFYDKENKTFLKYLDNSKEYKEKLEKYKTVIYLFAGLTGFFLLMTFILLITKKSSKKKRKILEKEIIKMQKIEPPKEKETKKKKKKEISKEEPKEEPKKKEESDKKEETKPKNKKTSKEEALEQVSNAAKIIEDYEKTRKLSKKELEEHKEDLGIEETMFNILEDDHKKKKK